MAEDNLTKVRFSAGSALLLTVVLTSLLAIVGVMFVLLSRVDEMSTSAVSENKELDLAVETIISRISNELVLDVPGVVLNQDYYDYPDPCNTWLASAGPYEDPLNPGEYYWQQISDVTGFLAFRGFPTNPVRVKPTDRTVIKEYPEIILDAASGDFLDRWGNPLLDPDTLVPDGLFADADGDGIADSKWIRFFNKSSNKGKPIYAAIRVIDNSAMLNVNTAYEFDIAGKNLNMMDSGLIDGSNQMQINLSGLMSPLDKIAELHTARSGYPVPPVDMNDPGNWRAYKNNVIRRYRSAAGGCLPFDMSDELELRYRNSIVSPAQTRLEGVWDYTIGLSGGFLDVPYDGGSSRGFGDWCDRMSVVSDPEFDKRHMLTTRNMDRIIWPDGFSANLVTTNPDANVPKMLNVNRYTGTDDVVYGPSTVSLMYDMISTAILPTAMPAEVAQMAVNLRDYVDRDSVVSTYFANGVDYHGFERPCPVISELVVNAAIDLRDPNVVHRSFGIEIRKQLSGSSPDVWRLVIDNPLYGVYDVTQFANNRDRYLVMLFQNPDAELESIVEFSDSPGNGETGVDPNVTLSWNPLPWDPFIIDINSTYSYDVYFGTDYNSVRDANNSLPVGTSVYKDNQMVTFYDPCGPGIPMDTNTTYYWRIDDIKDLNEIFSSSGVWSFTTWDSEPNLVVEVIGPGVNVFLPGTIISLERDIASGGTLVADLVPVLPDLVVLDSNDPNFFRGVASFQRDIGSNKWIKRLWSGRILGSGSATLGHRNSYGSGAPGLQTRIQNGPLRNIGEIGQIFNKDVYRWPWSGGETDIHVKTNLADPLVQQLFKYMTVFDPSMDGINNDGDLNPVDGSALVDEKFSLLSPTLTPEFEISGRININTAPWQVIAQLPWVSERLAQAIVAYRDKTAIMSSPDYTGGRSAAIGRAVREFSGFENIGELNNVIAGGQQYRIDRYVDGRDQWGYPDLTTGSRIRYDGSADDFEERDLIFSRISNLVTVRSDIFTAYILVRLGTDGPQKRVIAILDRSDVYPDSSGSGGTIGNVKVLALHPVPDPR